MTTVLNGVVGGLVAAVVTYVATRAVSDEPSLTAVAGANRFADGDVRAYRRRAFAIHLVYGGLAGGALVGIDRYALGLLTVPPAAGEAVAVGVGWGVALFLVATGYWWLDPAVRLDRHRLGRVFVVHLAYGLLLGLWIRLTWIT